MSEKVLAHFRRKSRGYWGMFLYVAITVFTDVQKWILERQDFAKLEFRDYLLLIVGVILAALINIKAYQSKGWHDENKPVTPPAV